jgi:hypothetical protein
MDDVGADEFGDIYDPDTLAALDGWSLPEEPVAAAAPLPSRLSTWSRSTVMGMVLSGCALGLQEVLDPKSQRPIVVEVDAAGEPHDLPIQLILDPDDPSGSLCIVRRDPPRPIV